MPLALVIFDMDDVLCHYDRQRRIAALAALSGRTPAEIDAAIWASGFEDSADAGALDAEAYLEEFGRRLGMPISEAQWLEARLAAMTPWPEMLDLAARIGGRAQIAVLTNNGLLTARHLDRLFPELRPVFGPCIHVSAELGLRKPDPAIFRTLLDRYGVEPAQALFTDDLAENVAGAEAAGLHGHVHAGAEALAARLGSLGLFL